MSEGLYQLVYYSRNEISGGEATFAEQVDRILEVSRRNNEALGITGALLFNAGVFAQVLEGPLGALEATFERIQQDDRHGDVLLLAMEPIPHRSFSNWAMGFVGQSPGTEERFAQVGITSGFDPARLGGQQVHAILRDLTIAEETKSPSRHFLALPGHFRVDGRQKAASEVRASDGCGEVCEQPMKDGLT